jgi:hypothetical protein
MEDQMKRPAFVAVAAALLVMMLSGTSHAKAASTPPEHTGYIACVSGWVYTDFVDPDGEDANLSATMAVYRPSVGDWTYHPMTNTGHTVHGVFFYIELAPQGIDPATVEWYAFAAIDEAGDWWGWKYANSQCQLQ